MVKFKLLRTNFLPILTRFKYIKFYINYSYPILGSIGDKTFNKPILVIVGLINVYKL